MPHTDAGLPFSGSSQLSRHTSHQGAVDAEKRALPQAVRLLQLLHAAYPEGYTDAQAAAILEVERSSINARRAPLVAAGLVEPCGTRDGKYDNPNTIWRLRVPSRVR